MVTIKPILAVCSMHWQHNTVFDLLQVVKSNFFAGYILNSGTLLPQARNKAVETAYKECPDFTHLIFLDDDMCNFNVSFFDELVKADKDIISALVVARKPPYKAVISLALSIEEILKLIKNYQVVESPTVGMAFTCIKREVLDTMQEETPDGPIWFTTDRLARDGFDEEVDNFVKEPFGDIKAQLRRAILFGQMSHLGSRLLGEDIAFCRKAAMLGFKSFVHCGIVVGHIGEKSFTIRDNLRYGLEKAHEDFIKSSEASDSDSSDAQLIRLCN